MRTLHPRSSACVCLRVCLCECWDACACACAEACACVCMHLRVQVRVRVRASVCVRTRVSVCVVCLCGVVAFSDPGDLHTNRPLSKHVIARLVAFRRALMT